MAKRKVAPKAKAKPKAKVKMRNVATKATPKVKAPKVKVPKPTLFATIGSSPLKNFDKPEKFDMDYLRNDLDCCFEGIEWVKENCPRGVPMDEAKLREIMMKPAASINFKPSWLHWIMNSFAARAVNTVLAGSTQYDLIRTHVALVLRSFNREMAARAAIADKHIAAGIGSQRDNYIELCAITVRHYNKL